MVGRRREDAKDFATEWRRFDRGGEASWQERARRSQETQGTGCRPCWPHRQQGAQWRLLKYRVCQFRAGEQSLGTRIYFAQTASTEKRPKITASDTRALSKV